MKASIKVPGVGTAVVYLSGFKCPKTFEALAASTPIKGLAHRVGELLLIRVELEVGLELLQEVLEAGEVAFWPPARSIVIALKSRVRIPSPVNYLGFVLEGLDVLRSISDCEELEALLLLER